GRRAGPAARSGRGSGAGRDRGWDPRSGPPARGPGVQVRSLRLPTVLGRGGVTEPLRVQRLDGRARLPLRAYADDAGLDLHAAESVVIGAGERVSVGTGIAVEIPAGYAGLVVPRSGLAHRHGIALVN